MVLFKSGKDSPVRHNLEQVLRAGNRAKELVKQILAFSRQTEQEFKPIQIGIIIKEALKLLRASLPTTIEIRQHISGDPGLVLADPTQIHQVVMNLCANSAHAMRANGGVLEVTLDLEELDAQVVERYSELVPGSYLHLQVRDTGHGMTSEIAPHLDLLQQSKPGEGPAWTSRSMALSRAMVVPSRSRAQWAKEPLSMSCSRAWRAARQPKPRRPGACRGGRNASCWWMMKRTWRTWGDKC
jgi:signal transduction histidine kinase